MVRPLTNLLKKTTEWSWSDDHKEAFNAVKRSLMEAPILALPDFGRPFSVVCDASDFVIGCSLLQPDDDGCLRPVSYQSRQLKAAELNYPVHDRELLAMKYALVKFRVYLLGSASFVIYTDHASLRTATNSPHLSQRMARWLSFFAEYNFRVEYKPGKENILADALSRRPDLEVIRQLPVEANNISLFEVHCMIVSTIFTQRMSNITRLFNILLSQSRKSNYHLDYRVSSTAFHIIMDYSIIK